MNIADNPISKPHFGDIIVAMLAYLEIRISDTLGWPQGILDLQYSRGCRAYMHWVDLQLRSRNIFPKSTVKLRHFFDVFSQSIKGEENFRNKICKSLIDAMLQ